MDWPSILTTALAIQALALTLSIRASSGLLELLTGITAFLVMEDVVLPRARVGGVVLLDMVVEMAAMLAGERDLLKATPSANACGEPRRHDQT